MSGMIRNKTLKALWLQFVMRTNINYIIFRWSRSPQSVLDIGCGTGESFFYIRSSDYFVKISNAYMIGVDLFKASLTEAKSVFDDVICCHSNFLPFKNYQFDIVISTEVLEHLSKKEGYLFIKSAELAAKKQVILTTPVMYVQQPESEWTLNPYQRHLSAWHPKELKKLGYTVIGLRGAKTLYGECRQSGVDFKRAGPFANLIFTFLMHISELFAYYFPNIAFDQVGIKNLKNTD